ncbi:maleylpyruvate isomerase family mycothiol-dependent enzyme [Nakamurella aerolata]|uniref:Maleylpyruvate isomerase family mycothiol-dependent enzyme n=1 Tax=Nakamurella aerolata TaxID=1656892 RepID=A0A849A7K9_9ACTN|nr:maleylpyruvate isomerase family mycothiol-dependent enzyme [Nakamurella aerolata]NNG35606.1 maleylpyruvate isomerase family mycothiol-dependent enzyme [Nakamurella aerolata]
MDFARRLTGIQAATAELAATVDEVGPSASVPTCPGWTLADLAGHQGQVHRWATAMVQHARTDFDVEPAPVPTDNVGAWLRSGADTLVQTLAAAPEDLQAAVFVKNAPPPREFWARRQLHETTIHAVDALAGRLGKMPTAKQTGIDPELAVDGLTELLTGFLPRRSSQLRSDDPVSFLVAPTDIDAAWTVRVSTDPPQVSAGTDGNTDGVLAGTAAALYLGLRNRGDEISVTGVPELLGEWREKVRVSWN